MMADYDYGNARIRALKSRLLSRKQLDSLAGEDHLTGLIAALIKTTYRKPIETALTRTSGFDCISEALHHDLLNALGKVSGFFDEQAGEMVGIILRRYDIHNLKAILRGLSRHVSPDEILSTTIPVGELTSSILAELARSPDPRAAIDTLAMMGIVFAQPLLRLRAEHPGAGTAEMELALDRWYFQESYQYLEEARKAGKNLMDAIQLEADLINLNTMLRFVHFPGERKFIREWMHIDQFDDLLVGPGKLPCPLLYEASRQDTVEAAVGIFEHTLFHKPLTDGLENYARSALLSDIEKHLKRFRLHWMASQIIKDPLGIGVLLGYFALKINEINNIRWIAHGINLGLKPDAIRTELEYPP